VRSLQLVPLCFVVLISTNLPDSRGPRLVRVLLLVVDLVALTFGLTPSTVSFATERSPIRPRKPWQAKRGHSVRRGLQIEYGVEARSSAQSDGVDGRFPWKLHSPTGSGSLQG